MSSDVARAFVLALDHPKAAGGVFNIGTGEDRTVQDVATLLAAAMGRAGPAARDRRQGAGRRHPPLHSGHRQGLRKTSATSRWSDFARAWPNSPNGWRASRQTTASARRDANSKPGASSLMAADPPRPRRGPSILWSPAARASSARTSPDRLLGVGHACHRLSTRCARPGVERNLAWLQERHGDAVTRVVADIRDAEAPRPRPLRRPMPCSTSPPRSRSRPAWWTRSTISRSTSRRRSTCSRRCAARDAHAR